MRAFRRGGRHARATCVTLALVIVLSGSVGSSVASAGGNGDPCIRIAMVYEGDASIPGFEGGLKLGEKYLRKNLKCAEVTAVENIAEGPGSQQTFERLADQGNDLVFGLSFGYGDQIIAAAEEYPDTKFEHFLGFQQADNVSTFEYTRYDSYYLAGVAAAMDVESGEFGFIAPFAIPIIVHDINAFTLGARSVNPDATLQVVVTNSFDDATADRQAAETLIDEGVDMVVQATGAPAGAEAAAEEDVLWMGHSDKRVERFAPEVFFAAPFPKWGPFFVERAQAVIDGTWESEAILATTADGITRIHVSKENMSAEARAEVKALRKQIADGSLVMFAGPINAQDGSEIVAAGEVGDRELMASLFVESVIGDFPAEEE